MFDSLYGTQLAVTAQRLEQSATTVRHRAAVLSAAAAACLWDGAGASSFRLRSDETVARLRRGAGRLDEAAAALRRHRARVDAALEARAADRARGARELLERGHQLADHVGEVLHDLGVSG